MFQAVSLEALTLLQFPLIEYLLTLVKTIDSSNKLTCIGSDHFQARDVIVNWGFHDVLRGYDGSPINMQAFQCSRKGEILQICRRFGLI